MQGPKTLDVVGVVGGAVAGKLGARTLRVGTLVLVTVMAAGLGAGCATTQYGYRPTEMVATTEAGFPSSRYVVTPEKPRGEAYVTSFGTRTVDMGGEAQGEAQEELVHVRLAVANTSGEQDWTVEPSEQLLAGPGVPSEGPAFLEVDGRTASDTSVPRGARKVFDLYYKLPAGAADASQVPSFDFQWKVALGGKDMFAQRTPFARVEYSEAPRARAGVAVGVGWPWWAGWYGPPWGYWGMGLWGYPYGYYPWGYPYGYGYGLGYGYWGGYRPYYRGGGLYRGGGIYRGGGGGGFRPSFGGSRGGGGVRAPAVRGHR